ncbi:unnamed protein product [Coffea canephora]|uniref:RING-type E3 ubiquitin transferase n=1 Tax=Coffea canephora TaxID=49390 RepID=A0A068UL37_COFCA|nr:unnamed protein product [Coffea canephora]
MFDTASTRSNSISNPVNNLVHGILSHDSNVMLAAVISLLLVILFVSLLHVYAKWFLVKARQRSRRSVSVPQVLGARFHHFPSILVDTTVNSAASPTMGLESSAISSIPLFVFRADDDDDDEHNKHGRLSECAICLSSFEDEEMGRKLPRCSHAFHVECIDMWLHSHSTCPICRCPVLTFEDRKSPDQSKLLGDGEAVDREIAETTILLDEVAAEMSEDQTSSRLEITVEEVPNTENGNNCRKDINSVCSTSSAPQSNAHLVVVGDSLKRIMSSRSRSERQVHPSASGGATELDL